MASAATLTSGVAERYATALFKIARDGKLLDEVERDIAEIERAHATSADVLTFAKEFRQPKVA